MRVRLSASGTVLDSEVRKATSDAAAAWGIAAVRNGAPYPRPLPSIRHCVIGQPITILLVSIQPDSECDPEAVAGYLDSVAGRVGETLGGRPFAYSRGSGRVDLRIEVTSTGELQQVSIAESESSDASAKALAAVEQTAPFPVPSPEVGACAAEAPFRIRVEVLGY